MSRRLPVPPPPGSPRERPDPHDDDVPDEAVWDDSLDDEGEDEDDGLLDPSAWPDDLDEPTVPEGLLDAATDIDELPELDNDDEEEDDEIPFPLEDVPLDDDLTDLNAPDDLDLPVLPWTLEVLVDGVAVPARLDPAAAQTLWRTPGATEPLAHVVLTVAGAVLRLEIAVEDAAQPQIVLGRDVLHGRFLLRP